jgi:dihydropteroate synthase
MAWRKQKPSRGKPLVMGVVNVTPDSFYDGGRFFSHERAIEHGLQLVEEGADILDVGGESTRPYADPTPLDEELRRVLPVIEGIKRRSDTILSIDTCKARVAKEAIAAGADIINDISGLSFDPAMVDVAAEAAVPVVIMHIKGTPGDMQLHPFYEDVIGEIKEYFSERIRFAAEHGVDEENIILDPGIGFGKRLQDNLAIIRDLARFRELGNTLLIGTSMKAFIGRILGTDDPEQRSEGTLASVAIAVWNGADIVRVHDVARTKKVVKFMQALMEA